MKPVTEEQKALLEIVAEELGGKLEHYICSDLHTEHKKYVITYAQQKRQSS
jgi:hypothetical protein